MPVSSRHRIFGPPETARAIASWWDRHGHRAVPSLRAGPGGHGAKGRNWIFTATRSAARIFSTRRSDRLPGKGQLTRIDTAFSRDQLLKIYVQDRCARTPRNCGDGSTGGVFLCLRRCQRMAKDVDVALHGVIAMQGGMTHDQTVDYVKQMKKDKRYQRMFTERAQRARRKEKGERRRKRYGHSGPFILMDRAYRSGESGIAPVRWRFFLSPASLSFLLPFTSDAYLQFAHRTRHRRRPGESQGHCRNARAARRTLFVSQSRLNPAGPRRPRSRPAGAGPKRLRSTWRTVPRLGRLLRSCQGIPRHRHSRQQCGITRDGLLFRMSEKIGTTSLRRI